MLRISSVSRHPAAGSIDRAIALGERLADIARRHGLTDSAVARRRNALQRDHADYLSALARPR